MFYIIGLIVTDGNISKDNKKLTLSLTDKDVILAIAPYFINIKKRKVYHGKPKLLNASETYTLINANEQTIAELNTMGIAANKTYTQHIPNIPTRYVYDFLRGVFDGDGCVYISNKRYGGYYSISFTSGSYDFANGLCDMLQQLGYSPRMVIDSRRKNQDNKTYYVKLNKQDEIKVFMAKIYQNADKFKIQYKYDKYYSENIV